MSPYVFEECVTAELTRHRFGPNTFPANNSALYACEVQVDYAARALVKPLMESRADTIEVKESVENRTTNDIQIRLRNSVFSGRCTNWYIGEFGRNAASWPGLAIEFWLATWTPDRSAFLMKGGSRLWRLKNLWNKATSIWGFLGLATLAALLYRGASQDVLGALASRLRLK